MIDPELKYCPKCNDEYRAEIVICAACRVPLLTGREKLDMEAAARKKLTSRVAHIGPDDDTVIIQKGSLSDLKYFEGLLAAENIGAIITGEGNSCGKGCCGSSSNCFLQVRRDDAEDAVAIIEAEYRRSTALDHHDLSCADAVFDENASEAVCPACGHRFATSQTTCPDCGLCFG